jgi:hypothetical protein
MRGYRVIMFCMMVYFPQMEANCPGFAEKMKKMREFTRV